MPEIKTRERVKNIKTLDKSAVIGQRMKAAFIRAKEQVLRKKREDVDASPSQYAETTVQNTASKTGQLGAYSAKLALQRGRQVFQQRRIKKLEADRRQCNTPDEHSTSDTANVHNFPEFHTSTDMPVERGREFARQQIVKRTEEARFTRRSQTETQSEPPPTGPIKQPIHTIRQSQVSAASSDIAISRRTIKTPQHTARATIKTPQVSEAGRQLALQDSARTAQITARTANATAKSAAVKAKSAAKSVAVAAKELTTAARTSLAVLLSGGWVVVLMAVIVVLFGSVLALFGDSAESNAYTPVSADVDAYTPLIQLYAEKHGIPDYVDLIKAIMMTESGGKGSDPMQASESGFNTKYPRKPKSITDPEYSIDVGVQT